MGDKGTEASAHPAAHPEFEARLVEELAKPEGPASEWDLPTHFVGSHDIIALIGNLPGGSDDGDEETPVEVVNSIITAMAERGLLKSARSCGDASLAVCIARCCLEGQLGCYIVLDDREIEPMEAFAPARGCVVVSVAPRVVEQLADALDDVDVPYAALGQIGGKRILVAGMLGNETYVDLPLDEL